MARDLGTKYICYKCGTKFYDLKKPVPACPKCGADQREAPTQKPTAVRQQRVVPPREAEDAEVGVENEEPAEAEEEEVEETADDE